MSINVSVILSILPIQSILPILPLLICVWVGVWRCQGWQGQRGQEWIGLLRVWEILSFSSHLFKYLKRKNISVIYVDRGAKGRFISLWAATNFPHNFHIFFHSKKSHQIRVFMTFPQFLPLPFFSFNVEKIYHKFVKIYADLLRKSVRLLTLRDI